MMKTGATTEPDRFRAECYGSEAAKWIAQLRRLLTQQRNGRKVSPLAIRNAANQAQMTARSAARFALKVQGA